MSSADINWQKNDIQCMIRAQIELNEIFIHTGTCQYKKGEYNALRHKMSLLNNDIKSFYTSTCSVCGDKSYTLHFNSEEHIKINNSWGYWSDYDCQTHKLTLCSKCYGKHIMEGSLAQYVKVNDYM